MENTPSLDFNDPLVRKAFMDPIAGASHGLIENFLDFSPEGKGFVLDVLHNHGIGDFIYLKDGCDPIQLAEEQRILRALITLFFQSIYITAITLDFKGVDTNVWVKEYVKRAWMQIKRGASSEEGALSEQDKQKTEDWHLFDQEEVKRVKKG